MSSVLGYLINLLIQQHVTEQLMFTAMHLTWMLKYQV
jgi:hypothetical protein